MMKSRGRMMKKRIRKGGISKGQGERKENEMSGETDGEMEG